jgi:fucose 4-O-acetylase-like acetyltransferase
VRAYRFLVGKPKSFENQPRKRPASYKAHAHVEWMDVAKGIGIFLVVFAHDLTGLKLIEWSPQAAYIYHFIYAFHMSLFFFVAGFFVARSARHGARAFVTGKLRTIAYPYFLWSLLEGAIQVVMSGRINSHMTWWHLAAIPYQPIMQYWFLYTLFFVLMLFLLCHQLRVPSWGVLALGVCLSCLSSTSIPPRGPIHSVTNYFIYLAIGFYFSEPLRCRVSAMNPLASLAAAVAGFGVLAIVVQRFEMTWPLHVFAGVLGTMATLLLARAAAAIPAMSFLRTWGTYSLQIFVAHSIVSAALRMVLFSLKVDVPVIHVVLGTAAGILVPVAIVRLVARIKFSYLFFWPAGRLPAPQEGEQLAV